jgi:hypothetical protein
MMPVGGAQGGGDLAEHLADRPRPQGTAGVDEVVEVHPVDAIGDDPQAILLRGDPPDRHDRPVLEPDEPDDLRPDALALRPRQSAGEGVDAVDPQRASELILGGGPGLAAGSGVRAALQAGGFGLAGLGGHGGSGDD